jgi:nitrogen fixation protein FixH
MKLDPGMHIVMQLVFFGKTGVTLTVDVVAATKAIQSCPV